MKTQEPQPYYFIGPERDAGITDDLQYTRASAPVDAQFLLAAGFEHDDQQLDEFMPLLKESCRLQLPMWCINPDLEVVKITGQRLLCAGVIAKAYEKMGGKVTYYGKPYADIYTHCMQIFGAIPKSDIIAVGDGLPTDIKGGNSQGIDTLFVSGGILKAELKLDISDPAHQSAVEQYCAKQHIMPRYAMPAFTW